jgi:hypothetical protein
MLLVEPRFWSSPFVSVQLFPLFYIAAAKELSIVESSYVQYFNEFVKRCILESFVIQIVDFSSGYQGLF